MNRDSNEMFLCVAYARVSTANEGQKESCSNQILLCEEYVKNNPEFKIVAKFVDDALSGGNDNRPEYQNLLARIQEGDIRYIIAKSTNRLCRSTEVDGQLVKVCRENNVMIIFLDEHQVFNPYDGNAVMMHSFKMIIDQNFIYTQSSNGLIAHKQKCEKKLLNATDVRYGYKWDKENKRMVIDEEEAAVVRQMFEWYVFGGLGVNEIAYKLAEIGVYGARSGKMLTANTVSSRLSDESYKGTFYINKKGSKLNIGVGAKPIRFDRPREEWVAVSGPAIISDELFDFAQRIREERRNVYDKPSKEAVQARFKGFHLFAGKVFCGGCGSQFQFRYADRAKTIGEYKDYFSKKKKSLDEVCNNTEYNRIREETLISICQYSINVFLKSNEKCIDNIIKVIRDASEEALNDNSQLKTYQKRLNKLEKESKKNLEAYRDVVDPDMKDDFMKMYQANKSEMNAIKNNIAQLEQSRISINELEKEISSIRAKVEDMKQIKTIDRNVVEKFIERIIIHKDGKIVVVLKFGSSFIAIQKEIITKHLLPIMYLNVSKFKNLKFIDSPEKLKVDILYYELGSCSDRT